MCGIAGVIKFGKVPISEATVSLLLTGNQHRGNDASGIAISQEDGRIEVLKANMPAWQFVSCEDYKKFIEKHLLPSTWGVIVHARLATKGNPRNNDNNHPMFAGEAAVVHNGMIRNDDALFASEKLKRTADTDSDIIRAFLDKWGITLKCIQELNVLAGNAAIAAFHKDYPKRLLLGRSGNPLVLASNNDWFMFSSEKNTLYKANKLFTNRFGIWFHREKADLGFSPMPDDTAWILDENGFKEHHKMKILVGSYTEPCRKTFEEHEERKNRWGDGKSCNLPVLASKDPSHHDGYCPNKKCGKIWACPKGKPVNEFICDRKKGGCGSHLVEQREK